MLVYLYISHSSLKCNNLNINPKKKIDIVMFQTFLSVSDQPYSNTCTSYDIGYL